MARKPRIQYPGAFYHVIARGNGGQKIFRDSQDYARYISFLREYKVRFGFLLYAYTLMPNHIHLLLEMKETPLSKVMQVLQFRYTRNFNIRYKKWGHLFQGRYKALETRFGLTLGNDLLCENLCEKNSPKSAKIWKIR